MLDLPWLQYPIQFSLVFYMTQGPSDRYNFPDSKIEPFRTQYIFKYPPKRPVLWAQHDILFPFF